MIQIPVKERLFKTDAGGRAVLMGSVCPACGTRFFPARGSCAKCAKRGLAQTDLAREGEIVTYTIVRQAPATWKGEVPYTIVWVKLDDGPELMSHLIGARESDSLIGRRVEVVLDKLRNDADGNEIVVHKFKLAPNGGNR